MNPSRPSQQGEVVKLGPPASGDVTITVDPAATGAPFAAGTQALLPGAEVPAQRRLTYDTALFVHKGQGRVTLQERAINVVPGSALHVPRGAWHGVRNTGTGLLQFAWVASPGLEIYFRELSRLGASPSADALQALGQRHGIEFRPTTDAPTPAPSPGRHRPHRRGGRRHRGSRAPAQAASPAAPAQAAAAPAAPGAPGGPRRRHQGRRGGTSAVSTPTTPPGSSRPRPSRQRSDRPRRRRRGKEVYMNGRWIWVEEGASVIAPGRERPDHRSPKEDDDDTPPPIRLSVPL